MVWNDRTVQIATTAIGVMGTLFGTILGWALSEFSRKGNIKIFIKKAEHHFKKLDNIGQYMNCLTSDESEAITFTAEADFYNSSLSEKTVKNLRLEFVSSNVPYSPSAVVDSLDSNYKVNDRIININPRQTMALKICSTVYRVNYDKIQNVEKVFLCYENEKNKKVKKRIKEFSKLSFD